MTATCPRPGDDACTDSTPCAPCPAQPPHAERRTAMQHEQLELGRALRDEGTALVDENTDDWWKATADQAIDHLASLGRPFTADDVRALGVPDPTSPRAWGARFLAASKQGRIHRVGYTPSLRASVHAHPIALWQGGAAA